MSGPCAFCGGKGEFLCDAPVKLTREEMLARFKAGERVNGAMRTCDKPFCRTCRTQVGTTFTCSRGRGGKGCEVDTVDHCPDHAPPPALVEVPGARCTHALVVDEPCSVDPEVPRMRSCLLCGHAYDRADFLRRLERDIRSRHRLPSSPWSSAERADDPW